MAKKKRKINKPKPSDLGTGAAAKAARKLQGRQSQIEAALNAASGGKPRKGMKERR